MASSFVCAKKMPRFYLSFVRGTPAVLLQFSMVHWKSNSHTGPNGDLLRINEKSLCRIFGYQLYELGHAAPRHWRYGNATQTIETNKQNLWNFRFATVSTDWHGISAKWNQCWHNRHNRKQFFVYFPLNGRHNRFLTSKCFLAICLSNRDADIESIHFFSSLIFDYQELWKLSYP